MVDIAHDSRRPGQRRCRLSPSHQPVTWRRRSAGGDLSPEKQLCPGLRQLPAEAERMVDRVSVDPENPRTAIIVEVEWPSTEAQDVLLRHLHVIDIEVQVQLLGIAVRPGPTRRLKPRSALKGEPWAPRARRGRTSPGGTSAVHRRERRRRSRPRLSVRAVQRDETEPRDGHNFLSSPGEGASEDGLLASGSPESRHHELGFRAGLLQWRPCALSAAPPKSLARARKGSVTTVTTAPTIVRSTSAMAVSIFLPPFVEPAAEHTAKPMHRCCGLWVPSSREWKLRMGTDRKSRCPGDARLTVHAVNYRSFARDPALCDW